MCGIAGVILRDGSRPEASVLRAMAHTLEHRGPDGEGVEVFDGAGLAHRRLAIIDLSTAAAQPMADERREVWVAFNGEIYNFLELKAELASLGHRFKTTSDTEVILAAWRQWGERCVARLDGMFAIALWDTRTRQLVLARDRTGKKPLYVYEDGSKLVFGSELKALFAYPGVNAREWPEARAQFLSHGYVPTPHTFYAQIRKVKPATFEVLDFGQRETRVEQYWDFPLGPERRVTTKADWHELEEEVRRLFLAAVKRRLVADVPLGAFLSGGVDSSLVVAAMAQVSGKPIKTFSIGFEGQPAWDETRYARLVAERYGTDHTEFKVRPEAFELVDKLAWHFDEPFGDSSCIPTYIVSKLTREAGCTVALTGDGGDEVFAGYSRFAAVVAAERVPKAVRRLGHRVLSLAKERPGAKDPLRRGHRFLLRASRELPHRLRAWASYLTVDELGAHLEADARRYATEAVVGERYEQLCAHARAKGADALNQTLYANARTYLLDDLNVKLDRTSMAASLECRSPFLDTALMEFAFTLPAHTKLVGRETKLILKRAFAAWLVDEAVNRPKMGFGVPLSAWLKPSSDPKVRVEERGLEAWALDSLARWTAST
jgi:asparagine synthase (glutamine-hydrolysing)